MQEVIIADLARTFFSRRGSWMTIAHRWDSRERRRLPGAALCTVRSIANPPSPAVLDLVFVDGETEVSPEETSDGALLRFSAGAGCVEACMPTPQLVRLRGQGLSLRLQQLTSTYDHACAVPGGRLRIMSSSRGVALLLTPVRGSLMLESDYGPKPPPWGCSAEHVTITPAPDAGGEWDFAIEDWEGAWTGETGPAEFAAAVEWAQAELEDFCAAAPPPAGVDPALHRLGNYLFWALEVEPRNAFKTPAWLVSKVGFIHAYSWDSAFTALGMWPSHPDKAWQCFMFVLENQHPSGMVCSPCMETGPNYRFTNPPVHGWVLTRMRQVRALTRAQCAQVYPRLVAYSNWWLNARDNDGDGLPSYFHGNDTGWDNSTLFDTTPTVATPDLATLLAVQFDELAVLAERLGKPHEAALHRAQAQRLIDVMLERLWDGEQFVARGDDGAVIPGRGDSLQLQHPIILGQRLPQPIRDKLITNLSEDGRFLCAAGFATESLQSPLLNPHGYWRGPVWPPPMAMICHGLLDAGAAEVARTAARRYLTAIEQTCYAECHNPLTAKALCHPFMPWTVAVYRELARAFGRA